MFSISGLTGLFVTIAICVIVVMCVFGLLDLLFDSRHRHASKKTTLHR
jgi:hypothetical protein